MKEYSVKIKAFSVKIKALTPIWTGNAERNTELRETGIIGSLRWWYEALIRGLGGSACDPTSDNRCPDKDGNHCDACELFGCTGWSRKFRLEVKKEENDIITLRFIELRDVEDVEWALLNKTLQIIAKYGAFGGRMAESRYGLIDIVQNDLNSFLIDQTILRGYFRKKGSNVDNPNIKRFIFITSNLTYEMVKEMKKTLTFLKGRRGRGKRYFYKKSNGNPNRLFVYAVNSEEYNQIVNFLKDKSVQFVEGKEVLEGLK